MSLSDMFLLHQVDEKTRQAMFKLRQTWNDLFPSHKLYALDIKVHQVDPAWPITAPPPSPEASTSIHVNPKFLKVGKASRLEIYFQCLNKPDSSVS